MVEAIAAFVARVLNVRVFIKSFVHLGRLAVAVVLFAFISDYVGIRFRMILSCNLCWVRIIAAFLLETEVLFTFSVVFIFYLTIRSG